MNWIYEAVYLAIFLQFVRNLIDKVRAPFVFNIPLEHQSSSGEFFVMVNGCPFFWSDDLDEASAFIYSAAARARSLQGKLKILESDMELPLHAAECILGLNLDEMDALNHTVDEFG
jgi:hypothetical protein